MAETKLASRMAAMTESATLALNARAKQMAAEGKIIYNLTTGELDTETPDYIQKAVAQKLHLNKYTPAAGLPELREAIARHARQFYDLDWIETSSVVATASTKPGLYASFYALLDAGDEVIMPVPAWVSHAELVRLAGGKVVDVPMTPEYDLDVEAIKAAITPRTKAILINSPHNPTGSVFSQPAIDALVEVVNAHDICVVADDIYTKLIFADHIPLVSKAVFNNLIIIGGFSKSQALTGWRIGYLIGQAEIVTAVTKLLSHITGNAPLPSQYAALAALERDDQPPQETVVALKHRRKLVLDGLTDAGIKHNIPDGAFYVFLDLRDLTDNSAEWCERLLMETGVALVPGEAFSAPGFARLTFVADEKILQTALGQISKFVKGEL